MKLTNYSLSELLSPRKVMV